MIYISMLFVTWNHNKCYNSILICSNLFHVSILCMDISWMLLSKTKWFDFMFQNRYENFFLVTIEVLDVTKFCIFLQLILRLRTYKMKLLTYFKKISQCYQIINSSLHNLIWLVQEIFVFMLSCLMNSEIYPGFL